MPSSNVDNALFAYVEVDTNVEATTKRIENSMRGIKIMLNSVSSVSQNFMSGFKSMGDQVLMNQRNQAQYWKQYYSGVQGAVSITDTLNERLKVQKGFLNPNVFQGWAMSLMFAGMALERTAKSIRTFGTKAFDEITHSVEGATTQNDMLQGSMKYLGFTIGEALDPIMGWLIPIVDKISNWVEQNPGMIRFGFILLTIAGIFFTILGMSTLAWVNGVRPLLLGMSMYLPSVTKLLTTLKTEALLTGVALKGMSTGQLVGLGGIIVGIISVIFYIFKLKDAIGSWGDFFKAVVTGLLKIWGMTIGGIAGLFSELWNWIKAGTSGLLNWIIDKLNVVISWINKVIRAFNKVNPFSDVKEIGTVGKVNIQYNEKFGKSFMDTYYDTMKPIVDYMDKNLQGKKGWATFGGWLPQYQSELNDLTKQVTLPQEQMSQQTVYNNYNINVDNVNSNNAEELLAQMNRYAAQLNQLQQG